MIRKSFQWIWDTSIKSGQKIVLLAISFYSNEQNQCKMSVKQLSKICGMSVRSVVSHMQFLIKNKFIKRQKNAQLLILNSTVMTHNYSSKGAKFACLFNDCSFEQKLTRAEFACLFNVYPSKHAEFACLYKNYIAKGAKFAPEKNLAKMYIYTNLYPNKEKI